MLISLSFFLFSSITLFFSYSSSFCFLLVLSSQTDVVSVLQAMQVIKDLRTTETNLMLKKRDLKRKRDSYLATLVPSSKGECGLTSVAIT